MPGIGRVFGCDDPSRIEISNQPRSRMDRAWQSEGKQQSGKDRQAHGQSQETGTGCWKRGLQIRGSDPICLGQFGLIGRNSFHVGVG